MFAGWTAVSFERSVTPLFNAPHGVQESELHVLSSNFPPRGLHSVIAVRDVLIDYTADYPVRIFSCICLGSVNQHAANISRNQYYNQ